MNGQFKERMDRMNMKISNQQLSNVSGIRKVLLSRILSGSVPISDESAQKFADITGMSKEYWQQARPEQVRRLLEVEFWINRAINKDD